jgi:hypothetical protein
MPMALTPRRWSPIVLAAALAAALAPPAAAKRSPLAPPGNSGIGQYVEVVPTASGSRPSSTVHQSAQSTTSSSGTLSPVPEFASPGSSGVSGATAQALSTAGPAGAAAVNLARATDPGGATPSYHSLAPAAATPLTSVGGAPSAVGSVLGTLTGSSSGGGLGLLLPVLLIIALVGAGALALVRNRKTT